MTRQEIVMWTDSNKQSAIGHRGGWWLVIGQGAAGELLVIGAGGDRWLVNGAMVIGAGGDMSLVIGAGGNWWFNQWGGEGGLWWVIAT
jgi:hypothetical protein